MSRTTAEGDIGRRLALRREELGLTREQVAERAGVMPSYLAYVEESAFAAPGATFLLRIADALRTTVRQLRGGDSGLPPGLGEAAADPELSELAAEVCWTLLSDHGVGRVLVTTGTGPAILPVNYTVADGSIAFRTAEGAAPALAAGRETVFEVDRVDEALSEGWSVLVTGPATRVTDPDALRDLAERATTRPWAGGDRDLWVRIDPAHITGRRITAA